ncbi:Sulfite reductase [ferredoxin] [Pseudomonas fluorescens]|uniref:Sulfite reductase [ferredoxin] n=1 Tax=Pseudomonas fluorescens TaxID=294 RepID=A0A5E6TRX1_PSEFL|nr:precorrin-3B synthase [Pseudomonas fluorescens]VVM90578.1 Sulfite reductase [ferredoxin] [Pseudomonas fluorescens]
MKSLHPSSALRPSACPGLLRVVQALDGGICRIKLDGGSLSADQAIAVADAAERYAGGVIEATNRGNLQIRGIGEESAALIKSLLTAGLGPVTAAGDDVRNLMLSPGAGIDRQMRIDTWPLARQILYSLQTDPRFHQLSAKFAVQLDGGEALAMLEHRHDLWLSATEQDGEPLLAFGLAGCPSDAPAAAVLLQDGHALVVAVLELFLDLARADQTRMRHLLSEHPLSSLVQQLAERVPLRSLAHWQRGPSVGALHLGVHPQRQEGFAYVGAMPPLGRLSPAMLSGAARLAESFGNASLRLTPWQSLLLPNIRHEEAAVVLGQLHALGLLTDTGDPLTRIVACTGSAGCAKGMADTKSDARQLAAFLHDSPRQEQIHLSGCSRSCACAHAAPVTLLATMNGHYDLYFREAGQPGFGALRARNLTIEAVAALLDARSRSPFDA